MVDFDLSSHSAFFNHLVDLIPAKHYLAEADDRVDLRFLKRGERAAALEQFKRQHKEAKRENLNPEAIKSTIDLQKAKSEKEDAGRAARGDAPSGAAAPSREALRAKLQERLAEMRKQRKADEQEKKVQEAKKWRETTLDKSRKNAMEKRKHEVLNVQQRHKDQEPDAAERSGKIQRRDASGGDGGFTFSKVDFGGDGHGRKGRAKPTKAELLAAAERRQAELADGKVDKDAWKSAAARAQGEKVLDDPRLLKKSMKKEAKLKKKKGQAWMERQAKQKEAQDARQSKRRENIQARITGKKDSKKAKREKKLLRAGFEGRKQGFIASPAAPKS